MSSSIFSKLANSQRHQDFLEKLDLQENTVDPGKKASSVGSMAALGLGFRIECPGVTAGITGDRLADLAGAGTALKSIRFICLKTGAYASVLPVSTREIEELPDAETLFSLVLKEDEQKQGEVANETRPETKAPTVVRKRGRPRKSATVTPSEAATPAKRASKSSDTKQASESVTKRKRGRPRKTEIRPESGKSGKAKRTAGGDAKKKGGGKASQKKPAATKPAKKSTTAATAKRKRGRPRKNAES